MRFSSLITLAYLTSLVVASAYSIANADELKWGDNVGPVAGYVNQIDHENGLAIRVSPSPEGSALMYIQLGTKIRGYNEFKNGWVKLRTPVNNGWVDLRFIKPSPIEGTVTKVNNAEMCLPMRSGPAPAHEKVGCAQIGEVLNLTGIVTSGNWLQLTDRRGWVEASSVQLPPELPRAVGANTQTPSVSSVGSAEKPSREKLVATVPMPGSTLEKESGAEKTQAGPTVTLPSLPRTAAPPPTAAAIKKEMPPTVCNGGWCVNFIDSGVTHDGKKVAGSECFKEAACANIVAKHHAAKATADGIMTFGNFKLLANGVILNSESGKVLANCNATGGIDDKCIANFLVKTVAGTGVESKAGSVSGKAEAAKEGTKKKAEKPPESWKPTPAKSSHVTGARSQGSSSPFVNEDRAAAQHEVEMKMNEEAWDDAHRQGF